MCLDKRMRISVAQIAIYCAAGVVGGVRPPLLPPHPPPHTPVASGCNLLALKLCVLMLCKCGSGLTARQHKLMEGTDFDNMWKGNKIPLPLGALTQSSGPVEICFPSPVFISWRGFSFV